MLSNLYVLMLAIMWKTPHKNFLLLIRHFYGCLFWTVSFTKDSNFEVFTSPPIVPEVGPRKMDEWYCCSDL